MNIAIPEKACTIDTSYSGLPCPEYVNLVKGEYNIFVNPWGNMSNVKTISIK